MYLVRYGICGINCLYIKCMVRVLYEVLNICTVSCFVYVWHFCGVCYYGNKVNKLNYDFLRVLMVYMTIFVVVLFSTLGGI